MATKSTARGLSRVLNRTTPDPEAPAEPGKVVPLKPDKRTGGAGRILVERRELARALARLAKLVDPRSAVAALSGVRIHTLEDRAVIDGTDLSCSLRVELEAGYEGELDALVSLKDLRNALKPFNAVELLELSAQDEFVHGAMDVRSGTRRVKVRGLRFEDWPKTPFDEKPGAKIVHGGTGFAEAVAAALPHASKDPTRAVLTGICLEPDRLIATDSYRLVKIAYEGIELSDEATGREPCERVNVPARELNLAVEKLGEREGVIIERLGEQHVRLRRAGETWLLRLIGGDYPNWRQLIPDSEPESIVTVERDRLKEALDAAATQVSKNVPLRIEIGPDQLALQVQVPDGVSYEDVLSVEVDGTLDQAYGVNPDYLSDCVWSMAEGDVTLRIYSPLWPILLDAGEDCAIVMPVRLTV
jgi:DNA polymerase-3 subunit beta